jgi:hypothetical protein
MTGASIETTLELWASSLRDVKARMRGLFTQRVAASANLFLGSVLRRSGHSTTHDLAKPASQRRDLIRCKLCYLPASITYRSSCRHRACAPAKVRRIHPHAVKNDTEFACKGNLRALHPATSGHIERPALQTGKARGPRQHYMRGLEQYGSHHRVADLADAAIAIGFAGLIFLRRQPEVGTHGAGLFEPGRVIDCRAIGQRNQGTDTRRTHQPLANFVGAGDPEHLASSASRQSPSIIVAARDYPASGSRSSRFGDHIV